MVDTSLLKTLFEDEKMVVKYLDTFRKDVPLTIDGIEAGIKNEEWEIVSILAHSLKSQLNYIKEDTAADIAYQIEKVCDQSIGVVVSEVKRLMTELLFRLEVIFKNLDEYLLL